MNRVEKVVYWFLGISFVLFLLNVTALAFAAPWWLQPFTVGLWVADGVTRVFGWLGGRLAGFYVVLASALKWLWEYVCEALRNLLDRLAPAIEQSVRDYFQLSVSLPTWAKEFGDSFYKAIEAAANVVSPWLTWTTFFVITGVVTVAALAAAARYWAWTWPAVADLVEEVSASVSESRSPTPEAAPAPPAPRRVQRHAVVHQ
jgi:hypothetical protein